MWIGWNNKIYLQLVLVLQLKIMDIGDFFQGGGGFNLKIL